MKVRRRKRGRGKRVVQDRHYTGYHRFPGDPRETAYALGCTNKDVAERKLREIVENEEKRRAGLLLPAKQVEAANCPLLSHLPAFLADHKARKQNLQHVEHLKNRNERLIHECGWEFTRNVSAESFIQWRSQHAGELSAKTLNDYLAAAVVFMKWLTACGRIAFNPLEEVKRVDQRGRHTFERRVLTEEEFGRVFAVAGKRRVLYLTAVLTGYRRAVLYDLRWANVVLDGDNPRIVAVERIEKNRREHVHPLRADLLAMLKAHKPEDAKPADRVFAGLWGRVGLQWLENDLRKAGVPVVETSGAGVEVRCDFHSLRHTSGTWAGEKCPSLPALMAHLNHKTPSQTARYVHVRDRVSVDLVNQLPTFGGTEIGTEANVRKGPNGSEQVTIGHTLVLPQNTCFPMKNAISSRETASLLEVPPRGLRTQ